MEQINTLYKSENLASALLSASCEILNDFRKYPEPIHNPIKQRKIRITKRNKKSLFTGSYKMSPFSLNIF